MQSPAPAIEKATRHVIFRDLLAFSPIASADQTDRFLANLSAARCIAELTDYGTKERRQSIDRLLMRFISLRVTPDLAETAFIGFRPDQLIAHLVKRYGDRLATVPGFYRGSDGSWSLNLPSRCFLYGYRSSSGHLAGISCQPFDRINTYFLLSSKRFGGTAAEAMSPIDKAFFEQHRSSMPANLAKEILRLAA